MPKTLVINGTSYSFPVQGDNPPWGDNLTNAISALVDVVNTLNGPSDILTTSFTIANNQSSFASITGLNFDSSLVRGAVIYYSIYRSSNFPAELSEDGQIFITYKSSAGTWEFTPVAVGLSGVVFNVTNAGQVQYTSTDIGSGAYVGKMKFKAASFLQA